MKRIIKITLLVLFLICIFYFSNQNGYKSSSTSTSVLVKLVGVKYSKKSGYIKIVRKAAHMSEFAILCFLSYEVFNEYKYKYKLNKIYLLTIIFSCGCAIFDELHQAFIPGRCCTMYDVFVDIIGIMIMMSLIILFNQKRKV